MNIGEAKQIIKDSVSEVVEELNSNDIKDDMPLFGEQSTIDSMKLVELCLLLEDKANEKKFEFLWTSDTAMSNSKSIFKTINSLSAEFHKQYLGNV